MVLAKTSLTSRGIAWRKGTSDFRVHGVVRVPDGFPKPVIEFIAIDDDLLRMDGFHGAECDGEVTGILDVDDHLGPTVWQNLADGPERFVCVGDEDLGTFLNLFIGHCCLLCVEPLRPAAVLM